MDAIETGLGEWLREMRTARGISASGLADRSGVTRMTLHRWETGRFQPRLPELDSVLDVLGATAGERERALHLIAAPRAVARVRETAPHVDVNEAGGEMPAAGDLLRAMRLRKRLSQEDVADRLGVHRSAVVLWEQSRTTPSEERLNALFDLLDACPEERSALTGGRLLLSNPAGASTPPDALTEQLRTLAADIDRGLTLLVDLRLLILEARLWQIAAHRAALRPLLAEAWTLHARWLWWQNRPDEAARYARRVVETTPSGILALPDSRVLVDAMHILSWQMVENRPLRSYAQAVEQLRNGLSAAIHPADTALLYRDMADYVGRIGQTEAALAFNAESRAAAERTGDRDLIGLSELNRAGVFMNAGRYADALAAFPGDEPAIPMRCLWLRIRVTEALIHLGERADAEASLESTQALTEEYGLPQGRTQTDWLAGLLS